MKFNNLTLFLSRVFYIILLGSQYIFVFILSGCSSGWNIHNPYEQVDWEDHRQYKANFHTHTTRSDGKFSPQAVVDKYHKLGYKILTITDHNEVTFPWTDFAAMEPSDRAKERLENGVLEQKSLTYENRDPEALGMVAIQGNEVSTPHHVNSFFTDYEKRTDQEQIALESIESRGGVVVINHPGRYTGENPKKYNTNWYADILTRFDNIAGIEIYNQVDRYPTDRQLWDSVLVELMPGRPVWGFSNDDFHGDLNKLGVGWNVFILPELTEESVRTGMEEGRFFYVHAAEGHNGAKPPQIESVNVNRKKGIIEIKSIGQDSIRWISGDQVIQRGNSIQLTKNTEIFDYVRAEIFGPGTITGTQPFGIHNP
ncbi:PHP domain-containing protein [Membranihabitans maritimus]|uniref:PHP domain-containing protein n=1 Tax=Membranihabitans maritimus TaxID=2904244 RepID=UPI001F40C79F|nr:hypothetical protein [Membranihabitans maritimus]